MPAMRPHRAAAAGSDPEENSSDDGSGSSSFSCPSVWEDQLDGLLEQTARWQPDPNHKILYFVRHAESRANVHSRQLSLLRPWAACQLCSVGFDSDISEEGRLQLRGVRAACQAVLPELEAVLYSPLQRAQETAWALFGAEGDAPDLDAASTRVGRAWVPLECLREERLHEHLEEPGFNVFGGPRIRREEITSSEAFERRIKGFLSFTWACAWSRFAVVGHSLWFRSFMGFGEFAHDAGEPVANASVWRITLAPPVESDGLPTIVSRELVGQPERAAQP